MGRNPRTAFDIIESLTGLLYPLKWEHPKILSYESSYEIFESPVPLIYYFNTEKLDYDKLRTLDLADKCLLFVDSNAVQEYCSTPGLKELPPKLLSTLEKELAKLVGTYSGFYSAKKATLSSEDYDQLLEDYKDQHVVGLEYWKVRECFFDFMRELLDGYQECYKESTLLFEKSNLESKAIFDFSKFIKQKSSLKNSSFVDCFIHTSLFSRFIECRIHPESENQAIYYNYFDKIQKEKKENSKLESLKLFMKKNRVKFPIQTPAPKSDGVEPPVPYAGLIPQLDPALFIERSPEETFSEGLVVEDDFELDNPLFINKLADEKWARVNIEMIQTVWFLCLRVFMGVDLQESYASLAVFAYDKIIELENDKIHPSLDSLKSIAFLLGIFGEGAKLQRIIRKFSKRVEENGQLASIFSEYTKGVLHSKKTQSNKESPKRVMTSDPGTMNPKSQNVGQSPSLISEKMEENTQEIFDLVPVAIKCEFSTNVHCPTCGTNIPLEIILAKMTRKSGSNIAQCPNKACLCEYEPSFNCVFLKQLPASMKTQESVKLLSPLNLLIYTKEFLEENRPETLLDVSSIYLANILRQPILEHPILLEPMQLALLFLAATAR